jgi:hypothetical protein
MAVYRLLQTEKCLLLRMDRDLTASSPADKARAVRDLTASSPVDKARAVSSPEESRRAA